MPLARIVTRFPESSLAASEYLRSRGYTVEIVDPGDFRVTPAVLELKLGRCTPDEALLRAQEALREVETRKADEPVSVLNPDTEEQGEAIAYDIAGRPVQFAERRKAPNTFRGALLSLLKRAWEDTGSRLPDALHSLGLSAPKMADAEPSSAIAAEPPAATQIVPAQSSIEADNLARAAAEREAAEREHRARIAAREAEEREHIRLQQESEAAAERERQRVVAAAREAELARQREQERVAAQRAAEERVRLQREAEIAAERERQRIAARAAEVARQR